jgi:hypothetical protein
VIRAPSRRSTTGCLMAIGTSAASIDADGHRWFWGLAYEVTEPANPPYGAQEPTRAAAMARFKAAYLACG